jgi:hypothetical protein
MKIEMRFNIRRPAKYILETVCIMFLLQSIGKVGFAGDAGDGGGDHGGNGRSVDASQAKLSTGFFISPSGSLPLGGIDNSFVILH